MVDKVYSRLLFEVLNQRGLLTIKCSKNNSKLSSGSVKA